MAGDGYGGIEAEDNTLDLGRDTVAFDLAARMIEAGRPVFGICRGLQELNVLFGGTLSNADVGHHREASNVTAYETLFDHVHDVALQTGGVLETAMAQSSVTVTSVHRQGIDRLGTGLNVEAAATDDGLIEALSARPCGGDVLAVQWHPEWDVAVSDASRAFFSLIGRSLRNSTNS